MTNSLLTLTIGNQEILAPSGVPTGGLSSDGGKLIGYGILLMLATAVILSAGFLVYGGINWIMSEGDKTKVQSARRTIIYAIVGLLVCLLSFFVISLLGAFFGIDLLHVSL